MEIRLYDSVQKLPGDIGSQLSDVFLTKETAIKDETDSELRDCLLAILEINLQLTAHIYINRKSAFFGGSEIRIVITTLSPTRRIVWGIESDLSPEGGDGVRSLHVDIDLLKVAEFAREGYRKDKKDFEGWKDFFSQLFARIRREHEMKIKYSQEILDFFIPV